MSRPRVPVDLAQTSCCQLSLRARGNHFFSGGCTALDLIRFNAFWAKVLTLSTARRSAPSSGGSVLSSGSVLLDKWEF
jgi:hypothetical protein